MDDAGGAGALFGIVLLAGNGRGGALRWLALYLTQSYNCV